MSKIPGAGNRELHRGFFLPDKISFFVYKWLLDMEISIL